jgi:hypothetical protein
MLWKILQEDNITPQLIETIKSLYKDMEICMRFTDGQISEPVLTNKVMRQGCGLTPILFNIYINRILKEWKLTVNIGVQLTGNTRLNTTLHADDRVLTATFERELQMAADL